MSWNIKTPGDYINGPLTVAGVAQFNSNVGIGVAPGTYRLNVLAPFASGLGGAYIEAGEFNQKVLVVNNSNASASVNLFEVQKQGTTQFNVNASGQVGIGANAFGGVRFAIGNTNDTGAATNGFIIYTNRAVCSLVSNGAVDAAGTTFNYSWANGGQGPFIIGYAGGEAARFNPGGTFILGGGNTAANGRGIAFPAAQSASTDANTLDDYEEGAWTGTLQGSSTNPTTPVTATGKYTKIGRQVTIQISFDTVNTTGASGGVRVSGLPFASADTSFGVLQAEQGVAFTGTIGAYIGSGGTVVFASATASSAARTDGTHNAGTGRFFWINMTYNV